MARRDPDADDGGLVTALRGSPELQFIASSIPGPVSYLDHQLRYRFVNDVYETLLPRIGANVDRHQILGKTIEEVYGEELASVIRPNIERALGGEALTTEVQFGEQRTLNSYIPHVVDGEVKGVLLVAQDITELHASRAVLIQSERMASLGRVVASLLHELNSPLGVLKSTLSTLRAALDRAPDQPLPARKAAALSDMAQTAEAALTRIADMTERLRSFSRVDEAEIQEADLVEDLETTLALFESERSDGVAIERDLEPLPPLRCRPGQLNQVFMSLLRNANAAIDGAGTITVRTRADEDRVTITFSDDGVGIAADRHQRIFEPSFADASGRVQAGLGLFVSRSIAERHGGSLRVDSEAGRGATFTLTLPR